MEKLLPQLRFPEFIGEWEEKKLGQIILKLDSGVSVNSTDEPIKENGEFGILKTSSISGGKFYSNQNKTIIQEDIVRAKLNPAKDAIIISRMNTPQLVGESGYIENDYPNLFVPDRLWMTTIDKNNNNAKMLSIILSSEKTMGKISNIATGTSGSMKNISKPNFLNLVIAMPKLPEQTKITTFLTAVDEKLTSLNQKKTLLEQYKKGVMQQIFSQELRFKDDNGNDFADWEEKKLGDLLSLVIDNRGKTPPVQSEGIPLLEVNSLGSKEVKYNVVSKYVNESTFKNWFRKYLETGDVLFSTVGNTALCSYYSAKYESVIAQNIIGLRFSNDLGLFMYYLLTEQNNYFKFKQIEMGAVQPSIKVSQMTELYFSLPCLPEQTKIANFLSAIDVKINHWQEQIDQTTIWKKGLLQQMFV
ncbi:restriction endonuclease subunit S [Flavobacterium frigoris]|uniref:Type I restriction enzyme, S subunit n=1 Tax=Flavobacterium frigoris TaxID=229204 RepID=A0A1H9HBZ1_FLAFI|nr:restriction endonuclease subunit S [Flavobacterium frigoris]SEQ59881.1 type I restriction enzyme, S subunit [Flavobacterium frigoris]